MVKRVNLDAMIPREDFGLEEDEFNLDLLRDFPIANLASDSPIFRLLRKPDFQRETNHWSPEQIATFVASFLDNEVIPGLILWKSPQYVFVIDGGHRLSALRAWMQDDYGDGAISQGFYGTGISHDQKRVATRTRMLIESTIGRFSTLKSLVDNSGPITDQSRRARRLFTRALSLQWVQGTAPVAETSFFKINSQGTPLDETEQMLIKHRRTAIAISSRAILRSGTGHKYWSAFSTEIKTEIESLSGRLFKLLFHPEVDTPLKSIDVPLGGSVSPVNALSLLIDFLLVCAVRADSKVRPIYDYSSDDTGSETISVLKRSLAIAGRITGNGPESLGLHPAVYFYNERGKHSQFMFLGITYLFAESIRNNNDKFWKDFTKARSRLEKFLIENKSLIGIILQNLSKGQRVSKMRDLFIFLIEQSNLGKIVTPEEAIQHLGLRGRIFDINAISTSSSISDDTKSAIFVRNALATSLKCKECEGLLDPTKSISYDHILRVREGGTGDIENVQLLHPFCNTGMKN